MDDVKVDAGREVLVGGRPVRVNESEWLVASSPPGTLLRVTPRGAGVSLSFGHHPNRPYEMVLRGSYFYDGVTGYGYEPDPDELIERTVFPNLGDTVEVLRIPHGRAGQP